MQDNFLDQFFKKPEYAKPKTSADAVKQAQQAPDAGLKKLGTSLKAVQKGNQKESLANKSHITSTQNRAIAMVPGLTPEQQSILGSALYMNAKGPQGFSIQPNTPVSDLQKFSIDPQTASLIALEFKKNPQKAAEKYAAQRDAWRKTRQQPVAPKTDFMQTGQVPAPLDPEQAQAEALAPDVKPLGLQGYLSEGNKGIDQYLEDRFGRARNAVTRDATTLVRDLAGGATLPSGANPVADPIGGFIGSNIEQAVTNLPRATSNFAFAGDDKNPPMDRVGALVEGMLRVDAQFSGGEGFSAGIGLMSRAIKGGYNGVRALLTHISPQEAEGIAKAAGIAVQDVEKGIQSAKQAIEDPKFDREAFTKQLTSQEKPLEVGQGAIEKPAEAPAVQTPAAKEPWQMTRKEWADNRRQIIDDAEAYARSFTPPNEQWNNELKGSLKKAQDKYDKIKRAWDKSSMPDERMVKELRDAEAKLKDVKDRATVAQGDNRANEDFWKQKERDYLLEKYPDLFESRDQWPFVMGTEKFSRPLMYHKTDVAKALAEGKPVPPEVLKDYPDLAPKAQETPNAIQEQTASQSVLRQEEPQLGLSSLDTRDQGHEVPPQGPQAEAQKEVAPELTPPSSVVELNSGVNPFKEPDWNIPANEQGGFLKVEVPKRNDATTMDKIRSPLSVIDQVTGKTVRPGIYERRAGDVGKAASEAISATERQVTTQTALYESQVDKITEALADHAKAANIKSKGKLYSDFIDLVEKPYDDVERKAVEASDTPLGAALRQHDSLTKAQRDYIIQSRRDLGIDTPDDWGITEQGYFRHMFLGDIEVRVKQPDGTMKLYGNAKTYAQAQKMALDILKDDPSAKILARPRTFMGGDPTVRVSNKKFWSVVKNLSGETGLTQEDIMDDLRGVVGRNASRKKFLGSLLRRTGADGFSREYTDVMRLSAAQTVRSQELSKLNKTLQPLIEKINAMGKRGTAELLKQHLETLWGTPTKSEVLFGNMIAQAPGFNSRVVSPEFAMRTLASKLTAIQYNLKLRLSLKGGVINAIQPLQTLYPFVSTSDFVKAYSKALKPSTLKELAAKGVLDIGGKLEQGFRGKLEKIDVFTPASKINRAVGYVYGHDNAIARGASEDVAHAAGLEWAKRVEFDNSRYGAAPILNTPEAKVLGQFKGFTFKAFENMADVWRKGDEKNALERMGRVLKYHGGLAVAGGAKATLSPATYVAAMLASKLYVELKKGGMSEQDAAKTTNLVLYGAPSLIGADVSSSLAIGDMYGGTPIEVVANTVLGPTVGTGATLVKAGIDYASAQDNKKTAEEKRKTILDRTMRQLTPLYKQYKALQNLSGGKAPTYRQEGKDVPILEPLAQIVSALGVTPVAQSAHYDYQKGQASEGTKEGTKTMKRPGQKPPVARPGMAKAKRPGQK